MGILAVAQQLEPVGGEAEAGGKGGARRRRRISRQLIAIEAPIPTVEWMDNVISHILPPHMKERLAACGWNESMDADVSISRPIESGRFLTYSNPCTGCCTPSSKTLKFEAWR